MVVFRKDPCGFTCLLMTYAAVLYADYVVIRWIGEKNALKRYNRFHSGPENLKKSPGKKLVKSNKNIT